MAPGVIAHLFLKNVALCVDSKVKHDTKSSYTYRKIYFTIVATKVG